MFQLKVLNNSQLCKIVIGLPVSSCLALPVNLNISKTAAKRKHSKKALCSSANFDQRETTAHCFFFDIVFNLLPFL